jgi:hypothetical protein
MYKIIGADGKEYGPVPADVLRQWIDQGRINAQTRILPEGAAEWKPVTELPEFAVALGAGVPPALVPEPISLPQIPRTNQLALTSLILGLVSITLGLCCFGLPFNLAGIICAILALNQINSHPQREHGKGMAIAGLVLCILSVVPHGIMFVHHLISGNPRPFHMIRRL